MSAKHQVTFWVGYEAHVCNARRESCPYQSKAMRAEWLRGWDAAK
jgi:ribosome modulation factor